MAFYCTRGERRIGSVRKAEKLFFCWCLVLYEKCEFIKF